MRPLPFRFAAALSVLAWIGASACGARPGAPRTTDDGLVLVARSSLRRVYVKPGANFGGYHALQILPCTIAFRKGWRTEDALRSLRVTERDMDAIRRNLAAEFHRVFVAELESRGGYRVVSEVGPGVLIVRPAIVDLDIEAPEMSPDTIVISSSPGQMTLYVELYDGPTSTLLARAIDPEHGDTGDVMEWQNAVTNKAAADRILRNWAEALRQRLDDAHRHGS